MGINQLGSAFNSASANSDSNWEEGFDLAGDTIAERDRQRGIKRLKGMSVLAIEFDTSRQEGWPTDFTLDEVRNSIHVACDHRHLSTKDMKVTKDQSRRASFAVRLPTSTCKILAEDIFLDIYPGPDSRADAEIEFRVYSTDERGYKVVDGFDPSEGGQNREAARQRESEQRKRLMLTIHYTFPKDLLMADEDSPIFETIKQDIRNRIKLAYNPDLNPTSQPQHINLLDTKTGEGESAHGLTLHIVNNNSFARTPSSELHRTVDLSHLKYADSGNGSLITSRMPNKFLKGWEAMPCCYRHNPMEVCVNPPEYTCPSDDGVCQLRRQTLNRIQSTLREGSSSYSPGQTDGGERISVQKQRIRKETHDGRRQAATAHRSTIQIRTCRDWEQGKCRSVSFVEGARQCRRAHPDEFTETAHIECCSSAARPNPERCYFSLALCPYSPGTHRDSW